MSFIQLGIAGALTAVLGTSLLSKNGGLFSLFKETFIVDPPIRTKRPGIGLYYDEGIESFEVFAKRKMGITKSGKRLFVN